MEKGEECNPLIWEWELHSLLKCLSHEDNITKHVNMLQFMLNLFSCCSENVADLDQENGVTGRMCVFSHNLAYKHSVHWEKVGHKNGQIAENP